MTPATSSKNSATASKRLAAKPSAGLKRNGHHASASPDQTSRGQTTQGQALTVTVRIPSESSLDEATARRLLTLALVGSGHLSQSQAARSLGISRYDLLELMGTYSLPIVRLDNEEAATENRNLQEVRALRNRRHTALKAARP
jgi:hypothetical protein